MQINDVIEVSLAGHDRILLQLDQQAMIKSLSFEGCHFLSDLLHEWVKSHGLEIGKWPMPQGTSHPELLLRELILKATGQWDFPVKFEELCHCRNVRTLKVDQAVLAGAHTPEAVSRLTQASTGCGTCRAQVEQVIQYRLGK